MNKTDTNNKEMLELAKHVIELAEKTPQLTKLQEQMGNSAMPTKRDFQESH